MSHHIVSGSTVRGPFTVFNIARGLTENLVDKHLVVLAVENGKAICAYTGTDADKAFSSKQGYVSVPSHGNALAGWKVGGNFYLDASMLCIVPLDCLEAEGSVSASFLRTILSKVSSLRHVETTTYAPQAEARVTGYARQLKAYAYC